MSEQIINNEGEGLILRQPHSKYEHGRSPSLLKYKASRGDKEALVVNYAGNDKYLLRLTDGVVFEAPADRFKLLDIPPQPGDVVSFSYDSYSRRDIPTNPRIFRIREDMSWEEVLANDSEQVTQPLHINDSTAKAYRTQKPVRYWTSEKGMNMRRFFVDFAKKHKFNHLIADNWYRFSYADIALVKGGENVLRNFRGSLVKALAILFPEAEFDPSKFATTPKHIWADPRNRRRFFEEFAAEHKFDPLVAENWYSIAQKDIIEAKGARSVMGYHSNSVKEALQYLFPEIVLDESRFPEVYKWAKLSNRRNFFLGIAKEKGFDPFKAENWYFMTNHVARQFQGGFSVLHYYDNIALALQDCFPEVTFDQSKFRETSSKFSYSNPILRRKFVEGAARKLGVDPLRPSTWYHPSPDLRNTLKRLIVGHFNSDSAAAITSIFPDISLVKDRIPQFYDEYGHYKTRLQFFINFARNRKFDPNVPLNWYSISDKDILQEKDGARVLKYYEGSLVKALTKLLPSSVGLNPFEFSQNRHLKNRREFFVRYAHLKGFDPLDVDRWHSVDVQDVFTQKGGRFVLDYYSGSLMKAIYSLFPEVNS